MTAVFLTALCVEMLTDNTWKLKNPLVYQSGIAGIITVPEGFETDFASVPRIPIAYTLAGDTAHAAAVVHDFLYGTPSVPRATADAVFKEAMIVSGVPWWRRQLMWAAVRVFGGFVRRTAKSIA